MQRDERDRLVQAIGDVSGRWREMDWQEFDDAITGILEPALTATGFVLRERKPPGSQDDGFDVFGVRDPDAESGDPVIGALSKKYERPIGLDNIRQLIGAASIARCNRAMMVGPRRLQQVGHRDGDDVRSRRHRTDGPGAVAGLGGKSPRGGSRQHRRLLPEDRLRLLPPLGGPRGHRPWPARPHGMAAVGTRAEIECV
jgi:hypothetical protein